MPINIHVCRLLVVLVIVVFSRFSSASGTMVSGEYIIKFKPKINSAQLSGKVGFATLAMANKLAVDRGQRLLTAYKGVSVQHKFESAGMMHLSKVSSSNLEALRANPEVEFVEPNYILSLDPSYKQNSDDADVSSLGAPAEPGDSYSQSFAATQVTESWQLEKLPASATKTIVAVIDTGLDIEHAVFKQSGAVYQNVSEVNGLPGVDDDLNGYIDDKNGWNFVTNSPSIYDDADHGTHVSGIILGTGQDIFQNPVRESRIRIMPLKFLDGDGSGTTANAISAIYYAVANGAKVINNSWGGPSYSRSLHDAYAYAYAHDVLIVTAAGNSNQNLDSTPIYPAVLDTPNNIAVGSSTSTDRKSSFSNYSSTYVNIFAPGSSIMSTVPGSSCDDIANLHFCMTSLSGTSMAAPFVAGLAALAMRESPQLSAYQIRGIILSSIDTSSYLNNYSQTSGRINARKVIQAAQSQVATQSWSPSYSPVYKSDFSSVDAGSSDSGGGAVGGCGLVKALNFESYQNPPPSGGSVAQTLLVLFMVLMPLVVALGLRQKQQKPINSLRKYERFSLAKNVMIQVGDQVINAASQTLAVGGLSFKSEEKFSNGQKIKLKISDVHEDIEGEIVWSSEFNSFGVKFLNITESLKAQVQGLTQGLVPT